MPRQPNEEKRNSKETKKKNNKPPLKSNPQGTTQIAHVFSQHIESTMEPDSAVELRKKKQPFRPSANRTCPKERNKVDRHPK